MEWVKVEELGGGWAIEAALLPGETAEEAKRRHEFREARKRMERELRELSKRRKR